MICVRGLPDGYYLPLYNVSQYGTAELICVESIYAAVYAGVLAVKATDCLRSRRPRRRNRKAPRRRFRTPQDALGDRLVTVAELADDDLELVTRFIDALVTKTRLRNLQADAS